MYTDSNLDITYQSHFSKIAGKKLLTLREYEKSRYMYIIVEDKKIYIIFNLHRICENEFGMNNKPQEENKIRQN